MYTIEDYHEAQAELDGWNRKWENYTGNNPDKYQAELRAARIKLRSIENYLKDVGLLPTTDREILYRELDKAFPNAKSKDVVQFNDKKYRRRFYPLEMSRSRKTVIEWGKSWEELAD